jgi:hypothetical protein
VFYKKRAWINEHHCEFSELAFEKIKLLITGISQKVFREITEKEKERLWGLSLCPFKIYERTPLSLYRWLRPLRVTRDRRRK